MLRIIKINRNADFVENAGAGGDSNPNAVLESNPWANFTSYLEKEVGIPVEKPIDTPPAGDAGDNKPVVDPPAGENKPPVVPATNTDAVKPGDKPAGDVPATEQKFEFKIPESTVEQPKLDDWTGIGKALGIDKEIKTFDEFKVANEERLAALKAEAEANKQVVTKDSLFKELDPHAAEVVKFLDNGGNIEEYLNPGKELGQFLGLPSDELMKKEFVAQGNTEAEADSMVTNLMEAGMLDYEAKKVRNAINSTIIEEQANILNRQQEIKTQKVNNQLLQEQKNTDAIKESLSKIDNFMGSVITDKHREHVIKEMVSGRSMSLFKDPKMVSEFLLFKAFGDQVLSDVKREQFDKGADRLRNELSVTKPELGQPGANRTEPAAQQAKKGFDAWSDTGQLYQ